MSIKAMRNIITGIAIILFAMLMMTGCETDNATLLTDSEESSIISLVSLGQALLTGASMEFQEGGTYYYDVSSTGVSHSRRMATRRRDPADS